MAEKGRLSAAKYFKSFIFSHLFGFLKAKCKTIVPANKRHHLLRRLYTLIWHLTVFSNKKIPLRSILVLNIVQIEHLQQYTE